MHNLQVPPVPPKRGVPRHFSEGMAPMTRGPLMSRGSLVQSRGSLPQEGSTGMSRGPQRGVSRHSSERLSEHDMLAKPGPQQPQPQRGLTRHYSEQQEQQEQQRGVTRHFSTGMQEPRRGVSRHLSERTPEIIPDTTPSQLPMHNLQVPPVPPQRGVPRHFSEGMAPMTRGPLMSRGSLPSRGSLTQRPTSRSRGPQRGVSRHSSDNIPEIGMQAEPEPQQPQPQRGLTRHYSEQRGVKRIPKTTSSFYQIMALEQQQNATAAEEPMRRLSRELYTVESTRNLEKSPLGGKKNLVSKPAGSIEFAGSSDHGERPDDKVSGKKSSCIHVQTTNRQWDYAELERYTSKRKVPSRQGVQRRDVFDLEQICSSYERKEKDAVSKIPGSIEFDCTKKTGHNLKLPVPRSCRNGSL
jgi:hypothetical protein